MCYTITEIPPGYACVETHIPAKTCNSSNDTAVQNDIAYSMTTSTESSAKPYVLPPTWDVSAVT